jgi:serine/threonine-protein kinase
VRVLSRYSFPRSGIFDHVKDEIAYAIDEKKQIIPVLYRRCKIPLRIRRIQRSDFTIDYDYGLQQVQNALDLRKTPEIATSFLQLRALPIAQLTETEVKKLIRRYDFYCAERDWTVKYCNPTGKGVANEFDLLANGGVIADRKTGLTWQQSGSQDKIDHPQIADYLNIVNRQSLAGYNDWRLPSLEETMSLVTPSKRDNDLHIDPLFDTKQNTIFTADLRNSRQVWIVGFSEGTCGGLYPISQTRNYLRAVRSGIRLSPMFLAVCPVIFHRDIP